MPKILSQSESNRLCQIRKNLEMYRAQGIDVSTWESEFFLRLIDRLRKELKTESWLTRLLTMAILLVTLTSFAQAYDPCWGYPETSKADCYRDHQELQQQQQELRQSLQNWQNQINANTQQQTNRAQLEDQQIQTLQQLQRIVHDEN